MGRKVKAKRKKDLFKEISEIIEISQTPTYIILEILDQLKSDIISNETEVPI